VAGRSRRTPYEIKQKQKKQKKQKKTGGSIVGRPFQTHSSSSTTLVGVQLTRLVGSRGCRHMTLSPLSKVRKMENKNEDFFLEKAADVL
jgi:hypothetical protein